MSMTLERAVLQRDESAGDRGLRVGGPGVGEPDVRESDRVRRSGWVRVVPAGEVRRPPTRGSAPRPRGRPPVRSCAPARVAAGRAAPRTRLLVAVAVAVFATVLGMGLVIDALAGARGGDVPVRTAVVSVGAGESLWEVAQRAAPGADTSAVVERIQELNDLAGGQVSAGMPIVAPDGR